MTKKDKNQILRNGLSCSRFKEYQVVENIAEILSGKKEMGFTFVVAERERRERVGVGLCALKRYAPQKCQMWCCF